MPRLVSLHAKRFKRWLFRLKGKESAGGQVTAVEQVPPVGSSQQAPFPNLEGPVSLDVNRGKLGAIAPATEPCKDAASAEACGSTPTRLSINDLPNEVFIRILSYGDDTNEGPSLPLLASWTCSRWRDIALHTPTLWSTVRPCEYGAGLSEVLLRSRGCGIDFVLDPISSQSITFPRDVSALLAILRPHLLRVRSLNLVLSNHDCVETALAELSGVVPNLQSLELGLPYDPCSGMQTFSSMLAPDISSSIGTIGFGSAEKLRVLKLRAVSFPWYEEAFSHLTTLWMASMCTEETMIIWEQLASTLLRNSSTLEELVLDQCEFHDEGEGLSSIITLPKLKYLYLRLSEPTLIAKLLLHVSMPNLETLELEFEADDQCEVFRALFPATSTCPETPPTKSLSRVRNFTIQGGAYPAELFCEIVSRMPNLERLMLGGCAVTAAVIRALLLPRVARKLTDMWLELCEGYCAFDLQGLVQARCGAVRVHEIRPSSHGQSVLVT